MYIKLYAVLLQISNVQEFRLLSFADLRLFVIV